MKYFTPDMECAPYEKMRALQSERLTQTVRRAYESVPHYRALMRQKGVTPADIRSVDDLPKLPFLCKDDLREAYPDKLLAVPKSRVVRIQSTSGTTGKRVVAFYTQNDIDKWDECCARAIAAAGGTEDDVVHVCYGYGLFTGGPGLNGGSHMLGSMTLPMSSGNTERQMQFMCDLGSTILCCTPSYAAYLAESLINKGMRDKIRLKAGIFGAEAWSEEMRRDIESKLGIKAYDIYGLTEITGPGVAFECSEQTGMHINEDCFIPEIIDPETGETLPEGSRGELVFTTIAKEAFPILRYRTRDICLLNRKPCSCGRTLVKMGRLMGRTDDMLIIRGINVFPSQIETVLLQEGYSPNYLIVVDRVNHTDTFEVQVELTPEMFSDTVRRVAQREKNLVGVMRSMLGISPKISLVAPRTIARSEGKAVRVIDKRKI
ncbi:MAG: phenylacetate--CoA ligase [Desulfovibrio sp.]|jgi:phenylacetate-CoA ligase|nr:phenylacetate--CoA ligase [Desulfovibrio sp.]